MSRTMRDTCGWTEWGRKWMPDQVARPDPTIWVSTEAMNSEHNATIERCAQVADRLGKYSNGEWIDLNCEAIAAAIRALKDKP